MKPRLLIVVVVLAFAMLSCSLLTPGGETVSPTVVVDIQAQTLVAQVETLGALATQAAGQTAATPLPTDALAPTQTPQPEATAAPLPPLALGKFDRVPPQAVLVDPFSGETRSEVDLSSYSRSGMILPAGDAGLVYVGDDSSAVYYQPFDGEARKLDFMNPEGGFFDGIFLASPDGSRIAWGRVDTMDATGTDVRLLVANLDGSALRTLVSKKTVEPSRPTPLFWSNDGASLYYSNMLYGIGGYILFGGYPDLVRLDLASGAETVILPRSETGGMVPMALSPDQTKLAFITRANPMILVIRDLAGNADRFVRLPERYLTGGAIVWKPDGSEVVFNMALNIPEAEAYTAMRVDVASMAASTLLPEDARQMRIMHWSQSGMIWLNDNDNNAWRLDPATGELVQVSTGARVINRGW